MEHGVLNHGSQPRDSHRLQMQLLRIASAVSVQQRRLRIHQLHGYRQRFHDLLSPQSKHLQRAIPQRRKLRGGLGRRQHLELPGWIEQSDRRMLGHQPAEHHGDHPLRKHFRHWLLGRHRPDRLQRADQFRPTIHSTAHLGRTLSAARPIHTRKQPVFTQRRAMFIRRQLHPVFLRGVQRPIAANHHADMIKIPCEHWHKGRCGLGGFGGRPSPGSCMLACSQYAGPERSPRLIHLTIGSVPQYHHRRGLGDAVAFLIRLCSFGLLKPCCACKWRIAILNGIWFFLIDSSIGVWRTIIRAGRRSRCRGGRCSIPRRFNSEVFTHGINP